MMSCKKRREKKGKEGKRGLELEGKRNKQRTHEIKT